MINSRDINLLKPLAQEACKLFLNECKKQGLNIFITQTLRDAEYQNSLYQQGRTTDGKIVTNCTGYGDKKSNHQEGYAWDIACRGSNLYDANILRKCGLIGKQLGIEWGGGWTIGDTPHFQIDTKWKAPKVINFNNEEIYLKQLSKTGTDGQKEWANNRLYLITLCKTGTDGQKLWAKKKLGL